MLWLNIHSWSPDSPPRENPRQSCTYSMQTQHKEWMASLCFGADAFCIWSSAPSASHMRLIIRATSTSLRVKSEDLSHILKRGYQRNLICQREVMEKRTAAPKGRLFRQPSAEWKTALPSVIYRLFFFCWPPLAKGLLSALVLHLQAPPERRFGPFPYFLYLYWRKYPNESPL